MQKTFSDLSITIKFVYVFPVVKTEDIANSKQS